MTYKFKLSCRLALLRSSACALLLMSAGCLDSDMASMSPYDQIGGSRAFSEASNRRNFRGVDVVPSAVELAPGQSMQFSIRTSGKSAAPVVHWAAVGGTIGSSGNYIAGETAGTYQVIATDTATGVTDTAKVTVTVTTPTAVRHMVRLILAPATAALVVGGTQHFSASAEYDDGSTAPAWALFSASGGTITQNGDFTSGQSAGTVTVTGTSQDGAFQSRASVSVTASSSSSTLSQPVVLTPTASVLFSDDFSGGNLSKSVDGWSWSGVWVDVVRGFSKDGNVGSSARFTFNGTSGTAETDDAWSELRFTIGAANLTELWATYWLYYPSGNEAVWRGPKFLHRTPSGGTNNKFFMVWENYDVGHMMYGAQTWSDPAAPGNGFLIPSARDASGTTQHFWDTVVPWETDSYRGRWIKVEVYSKAPTGPGSADGVLQYYRDGARVVDIRNVDGFEKLGSNTWKAGYLLGWSNSGFSQTTYAYVSNVTFSRTRLP